MVILSSMLLVLSFLTTPAVELYQYSKSLASSDVYSVKVEGSDVKVLPTQQAHVAQFGSDSEVKVEITLPEIEVRTVDIRPISKGYEYELEDNVIKMTLKPYDRVSVEVNGNTSTPLLVFVNPLEAQKAEKARNNRKILYFKAGNVYPLKKLVLNDYDGLYIEGGAVVKAIVLSSDLYSFNIDGCGILDATAEGGNAAKFASSGKLSLNNLCILNKNMAGCQFVNCTDLSLNNVKVVNLRSQKVDNNKTAFGWSGCKKVHAENLFAYSQSAAFSINNKYAEIEFPSSDISFSDCIGWNALTSNTLSIVGSSDMSISNVRINDFYAIHSAGNKPLFHRSSVYIKQTGTKGISNLSFRNFVSEDPKEYLFSFTGWISNVKFDGVTVLSPAPAGSELQGIDFDHRVENVVFKDIMIDGKKIHSLKQAGFKNPSLGLNIVFE